MGLQGIGDSGIDRERYLQAQQVDAQRAAARKERNQAFTSSVIGQIPLIGGIINTAIGTFKKGQTPPTQQSAEDAAKSQQMEQARQQMAQQVGQLRASDMFRTGIGSSAGGGAAMPFTERVLNNLGNLNTGPGASSTYSTAPGPVGSTLGFNPELRPALQINTPPALPVAPPSAQSSFLNSPAFKALLSGNSDDLIYQGISSLFL